MKKGTRGFTLIELLVVIAIIAILAAILFPVFTQARAKARQISCLSNVKNLSLAVLMYVDDYDGKFPLVTYSYADIVSGWGTAVEWPNNVAKYIGAPEILHCPADGNMSPTMGPCLSYAVEGETCLGVDADEYYSGYWSDLGGMFTCYGRPEASIPEPGNTIMLQCAQIDFAIETMTDNKGVWRIRDLRVADRIIPCNIGVVCNADSGDKYAGGIIIHNGGTNYGFADGHAKWMKIEKAYYPSNLFVVIQPNPGGVDPFGNLLTYGKTITTDF
jgi:prepilin-type N-terminal cleavage/methylation domain-containing protein/prepilin-type processing-associated H-X9-DG protein